jgi:exopolyphosphatase/guanosine-5'-triphosphate,3'-diphosphate pyrophosphatase
MDEIADRFGVEEITFSEGALRDGVLLDTLERRSAAARVDVRNVTERSIRALQERCDDDPAHSNQVAQLALQLFDGLAPWHGLEPNAREYLGAAARLANVGLMISYNRHHVHSYYIIRNSELVGLTDHEIELIALIARYHRKSPPKASHPEFAGLRSSDQDLVRVLAAILRVAIGLDRSHEGRVEQVRAAIGEHHISITARPAGDADINLELYTARERSGLLAELSGRNVEIS